MGSSLSTTARRVLGATAAAITCLALAVGLSGCPVAAELENPTRFEAIAGSTGTAGSGNTDCNQPLPDGPSVIGCDYRPMLAGGTAAHCAVGGCHNQDFKSAGLDLTPNDSLIARILNVPAKHGSINCSGTIDQCVYTAPNCPACEDCPMGDMLLSTTDFANSWIIKKMDAFDVANPGTGYVDMRCGTAMPFTPGNDGFTAERRDCLKSFFQWIATNGRPCTIAPPAGGSGGGGAGGASTAGTGGT
jgi:hypothetical protein